MALQDILKKIEEESKEVADKIIEEARLSADKILKEGEDRLHSLKRRQEEEIQKEKKERKDLEILRIKAEKRNLLLRRKRELLEEFFELLEKRIVEADELEYESFWRKLLKDNIEGGENVYIPQDSIRPVEEKVFLSVGEELEKNEGKRIKLAGRLPSISAGFILEKDRKRVNLTLSSVKDRIREEKEMEIAKILFGNLNH